MNSASTWRQKYLEGKPNYSLLLILLQLKLKNSFSLHCFLYMFFGNDEENLSQNQLLELLIISIILITCTFNLRFILYGEIRSDLTVPYLNLGIPFPPCNILQSLDSYNSCGCLAFWDSSLTATSCKKGCLNDVTVNIEFVYLLSVLSHWKPLLGYGVSNFFCDNTQLHFTFNKYLLLQKYPHMNKIEIFGTVSCNLKKISQLRH